MALKSVGGNSWTGNLVVGLGVAAGTYSLVVQVTDNGIPTPVSNFTNLALTVNPALTTAISPGTAYANQPVTVAASVSPFATNVPITALSMNLAPIGGSTSSR